MACGWRFRPSERLGRIAWPMAKQARTAWCQAARMVLPSGHCRARAVPVQPRTLGTGSAIDRAPRCRCAECRKRGRHRTTGSSSLESIWTRASASKNKRWSLCTNTSTQGRPTTWTRCCGPSGGSTHTDGPEEHDRARRRLVVAVGQEGSCLVTLRVSGAASSWPRQYRAAAGVPALILYRRTRSNSARID